MERFISKPEIRLAKSAKILYYLGAIAAIFIVFNAAGNKDLKIELFIIGLLSAFLIVVLGFALVVLSEILFVLRKIESNQSQEKSKQ